MIIVQYDVPAMHSSNPTSKLCTMIEAYNLCDTKLLSIAYHRPLKGE